MGHRRVRRDVLTFTAAPPPMKFCYLTTDIAAECQRLTDLIGDAENARNENTRRENAAPKIRGENGKSET